MNQLRPNLPPLPERMKHLPVEDRGYPVPFFVAWIDGKPDFRIIDPAKMATCVKDKRCWLCGGVMGAWKAFVIGPMCAVNRVSSEPPSHRECAEYAAKACPFLTMPKMDRRESGLTVETVEAAGVGLKRNPGVALVWITKKFSTFRAPRPDGSPGMLFDVGEPEEALWFARGREATREEVLESINSGLPELLKVAEAESREAVEALAAHVDRAMKFIPAGPPP